MDGIIIINKPKDCTSHDIVKKVKKVYNEKVGHTGTLDPLATGVLPILVGKGTLCSKYLIKHDKKYHVLLKLGKKTSTADSEGEIIESRVVDENVFNKEFVKNELNKLIGKQQQIPPIYSAIKYKGKKLYEYARKGIEVEIKPRDIEIYNINLLNIDRENQTIEYEVECSKGTYIRSLCETIADKLGTIGYMCELKRIQVGDFSIIQSITIDKLEKEENIITNKSFYTIEKLFEKNENIEINNIEKNKLLNGVKIIVNNKDGIYKIYNNNQFLGIGIVKERLLKRDIII